MQAHKWVIITVGLMFVLIGALASMFSALSGSSKLVAVIISYVVLIAIIYYTKLGRAGIGLDRDAIWKGVHKALPIVSAIILLFGLVFIVQPDVFRDRRYTMDGHELLFYVFIIMPLMTVVLEELAFRGIMLGILLRRFSTRWAVALASVAFGLWHVFSAQNVVAPDLGQSFIIPHFIIVIAVLAATAAAGAVLSIIRLLSGSLIAPIMVHWTINASATCYVYLAWHQ